MHKYPNHLRICRSMQEKRKQNFILMVSTKIRISCAGMHKPEHGMKLNSIDLSYVKEPVYAFIDLRLIGKSAFMQ